MHSALLNWRLLEVPEGYGEEDLIGNPAGMSADRHYFGIIAAAAWSQASSFVEDIAFRQYRRLDADLTCQELIPLDLRLPEDVMT